MRAVLDGSVALNWEIVEPDSAKAIRLRDDFRNATHELIAPETFALECAHSLTKKQRQGLIPDARTLWNDIMLDSPAYFPWPSWLVPSRSPSRCGTMSTIASTWPWPSEKPANS